MRVIPVKMKVRQRSDLTQLSLSQAQALLLQLQERHPDEIEQLLSYSPIVLHFAPRPLSLLLSKHHHELLQHYFEIATLIKLCPWSTDAIELLLRRDQVELFPKGVVQVEMTALTQRIKNSLERFLDGWSQRYPAGLV